MHNPSHITSFRYQQLLTRASLFEVIWVRLEQSCPTSKPANSHANTFSYTMGFTNLGLSSRSYTAILACLLPAPTLVASQLCYDPSGGTLINFGICNNASSTSVCCPVSNECMSNGLCLNPLSGSFNRGGCTDESFKDPVCPGFCTRGSLPC